LNKQLPINGAAQLIHLLLKEGVDTIFGYPGGAVLPIYDALYDCSQIRHILTRHEQAAVHAADGYARVLGKPGVALVTSGPGATNAITGIATAYMDSIPLVVLTGQVSVDLIGLDSFQEVDIYGMTMSITKHNYLVKDIAQLPRIVHEAFYLAQTGRPGPVLIDLPKNMMAAPAAAPCEDTPIAIRGYIPCHSLVGEQLDTVADRLTQAKRPVLITGGGVVSSASSKLLEQIAVRGAIPVVSTLMGIGSFPTGHPQHLGMLGMHGTYAANRAIHSADLLISLGVRFSDRVIGQRKAFSPGSYKIHIDIDAAELGKNIHVDLPIQADLHTFLTELEQRLKPREDRAWSAETSGWQKRVPHYTDSTSKLKPQDVIRLLSGATAGDAIVATDVGQHQIWTAHHYAFSKARSFLTSGGLGTMGYGFPAAIGAAIAAPHRTVLCISGDGSFQMNLQEMMTAVDEQLPIKIAILNNGYLGMVRQWQQLFYDRRYSSVRLTSPDYVAFARSYGAAAFRASTLDEADDIIASAMQQDGPVLMEFNIQEEENVFPFVPPGRSNQEMIFSE
jgi:acetolactate synthase-1/2/3 large subunit